MAKKVKRSNQRKIPISDKRDVELKPPLHSSVQVLPPYRPTALPPKHPHHTPTPNRRGR
jgi:hypothetical protein